MNVVFYYQNLCIRITKSNFDYFDALMKKFKRQHIEYILLVSLYSWIGYCSIVNMGSIASIVFLLLVLSIGALSLRASFCAMFAILFGSMASLNMPSPIIISSGIFFIINTFRMRMKGKELALIYLLIPFFIYLILRLASCLDIRDEELYTSALTVDFVTFISISLAILLVNDSEDVAFVERWIGIVGVLASIYGLFYFLYNDVAYLRSLYEGTDFAGKGVIEGADLIKAWLRWAPVDKEPNFWAAFLLFPLGYWISILPKRTTPFTIICLSITYIGIIFSYSRSSFLVASFVLFLAFFKSRRKYFFSMILIFVVICVGIYISSPDVVARFLSISDNIKSEGGSGRFELWGEALNNFCTNPIIGIGTGQTPAYSPTRMGTHNLYLQLLGENGLIGFSLFSFIWFTAFIKMKKYTKCNGFYYYAFLGYSINQMTIHNFDLRVPFFVIILFYVYARTAIQSKTTTTIIPSMVKEN